MQKCVYRLSTYFQKHLSNCFKFRNCFKSLQDGLDEVDSTLWRDVVDLQRHWIGDITGARFDLTMFWLESRDVLEDQLSVFTTTPELLYGVSHIFVSPQHYLSQPQFHEPFQEDREH